MKRFVTLYIYIINVNLMDKGYSNELKEHSLGVVNDSNTLALVVWKT